MRLSELKIDPDFRDCLPKLSNDEYKQLERNILERGIEMPLMVWNGYVVDGHNRYNICFNNQIKEVPVKETEFKDKQDALEWILKNQLGRRNLTDFGRNEIALKYKEVIAKRAKERQGARTDLTLGSNEPEVETGRTSQKVANIAGTNPSSVKRTEFILKHGTDEEKERARDGGKGNSQNAIVNEIKKRITPPGMKLCSKCGELKPVEEFHANKEASDGLASNCNACHNKVQHAWYERNKAKEIVAEMYSNESKPYTAYNLKEEVIAKANDYTSTLRNQITDRLDVLNDDSKAMMREVIASIIAEIKEIEDKYL